MSLEAAIQRAKGKRVVAEYFDAESAYWNTLYEGNDVMAVIYQERRWIALQSFCQLSLPKESRILEVGCGAGLLTADLARRGYVIEALDRVKSMVDLTRQNALKSGVEDRIHANIGDVYQLPFRDRTFKCLIALGVIPWVVDINRAMKELSRVLVPGGYAIITADNRYRLNHIVDPAHMPVLAGVKDSLKRALEKFHLRKPSKEPDVYRYSFKEFNQLLASVGLARINHHMVGFGPFSFFRYELFPGPLGVRLHHRLQRYSDRGLFLLRSTGSQILVTAAKS